MDPNQLPTYQILQPALSSTGTLSQGQAQPSEEYIVTPGSSTQSDDHTVGEKKKPPSCNLCRRGKIKCDRADPCFNCVRMGAVCVTNPRLGLPRGRRGGRRKADSALLDRIAKLESLVKDIAGRSTGAAAIPAAPDGSRKTQEESQTQLSSLPLIKSAHKAPKDGLNRYLGVSLWMSLSDEINGMREVLYQSSDDEDEQSELTPDAPDMPDASLLGFTQPGQSSFVIFAPLIPSEKGDALQHPSPSKVHSIYEIFMANVDPMVKILHGPSLRRFLVGNGEKLDCSPGPNGWDALKFAIYYTATSSLTPEECKDRLKEEKAILLSRFRSGTELSLARADFVNTEDMSTLQALVLYLFAYNTDKDVKFAVRSNENSRRTWTLTSLAVRIAHALGLHRETIGGKYISHLQPFDREMRRRLWWQICLLDRHSSADRGSDPIITANSFSTQFPLNVNDEDLTSTDSHEIQPREGYTDFTFSLVCHELFDVERRLNYVPAGEIDSSYEKANDKWAQKRALVTERQRRIEDMYLRHCNMNIPLQRYTKLVADAMIATMWLWTYRPLQKHPEGPTSANIPYPGILHLAVEVMEKAVQVFMDTSTIPFGWISSIWVQWHALAVMIAELCVQTDGPTVERAWGIVHTAFEETARHIADTDKGRLWRPIKKLMNKAQAVRKKHLEDISAASASLVTAESLRATNQTIPFVNARLSEFNFGAIGEQQGLPDDSSGFVQQLPQGLMQAESVSMNWDSWADAGLSDQMDYSNEMNQMAWTNWESFVDDFQRDGNFPAAQEEMMPSYFHTW